MKNSAFCYVVLNKPAGYVSARKDNMHPTIMDLVPENIKKLHIVGRLDKDTTGLIVLTNDGDYTHRATHPKRHVPKTYEVTLRLKLGEDEINLIRAGMTIDHNKTKLKPAEIQMITDTKAKLTITEGKFHQVKKMFASLGNEVVHLHRIGFDALNLAQMDLKEGEYVILSTLK